ncbi:unnamed protein product [Mytilus coruscus]|uniref:Uncharacterized protein n=1 Tax=Mytilus coruscus TaxID=42192 RepID=A0A6J8A8B4_MYTCO|nr:unnamed protein product [Mytilus coruscus]
MLYCQRINTLSTDYLTQVIMHQQNMSTHGVPKSTTPDRNCFFFHSISVALYGTEQHSLEFRLRTCLQMCLHPELYKNRPDVNDIFILSPSFVSFVPLFEESVLDCSRPAAYSSIWTMIAVSDALGIAISSIYPAINGHQDLAVKVLNTVFEASTMLQTNTKISIMWTHSSLSSNPCEDNSNYIKFVPQSHSSPRVKTSNPLNATLENYSTDKTIILSPNNSINQDVDNIEQPDEELNCYTKCSNVLSDADDDYIEESVADSDNDEYPAPDDVNCLPFEQRIRGQVVWTPLEPQPPQSDEATMQRYETVLKSNGAFKKHVSWFSSTSDTKLSDIALYEYQGTYVINSDNKVRTHPNIIRQVQSEFSDKKPKEIFLQMNQDNSITAPHDTKQIKNAKYRQRKANQPSNSNNIAD